MHVHPAWQRQGIRTALMLNLIELGADVGLEAIVDAQDNDPKAVRDFLATDVTVPGDSPQGRE